MVQNGFNNLSLSLIISGILLSALIIFSIGFYIQSKKNKINKIIYNKWKNTYSERCLKILV